MDGLLYIRTIVLKQGIFKIISSSLGTLPSKIDFKKAFKKKSYLKIHNIQYLLKVSLVSS
jgi:hypothetical protein